VARTRAQGLARFARPAAEVDAELAARREAGRVPDEAEDADGLEVRHVRSNRFTR
jgi:hypothetical protein